MRPIRTPLSVSSFAPRRADAAARARGSARRRKAAVALFSATVLLAACSFEYSDPGAFPDELLENIPETELADVTHTIVRDGRVVAEIRARHVWNFRRRAQTIFEDVRYTEYDAAGTAVTTGSAVRAAYYTERGDAILSGAIRLRSQTQGVRLKAVILRWDDERRRLVSSAEDTVELSRDDGSQVSGTGLEVDVRSKTIRFSGQVSGTLVTETGGE